MKLKFIQLKNSINNKLKKLVMLELDKIKRENSLLMSHLMILNGLKEMSSIIV